MSDIERAEDAFGKAIHEMREACYALFSNSNVPKLTAEDINQHWDNVMAAYTVLHLSGDDSDREIWVVEHHQEGYPWYGPFRTEEQAEAFSDILNGDTHVKKLTDPRETIAKMEAALVTARGGTHS